MSKQIKLSASRINSFLSCKQKYWFSYHERLPKVANPAFVLGIAVHEALELAGGIWMEENTFSKDDVKLILKKYNEVSIREGLIDLFVHEEGKDLVKKKLNNFILGKKIISLEAKFGFYNDPKNIDVYTKYGVPLIGAIDKVEEYDKETLLIVDYKTSKTIPTTSQLRYDAQLSIYNLVAKQLWPNYKRIILALDMLKDSVLLTYRTKEETDSFELYLSDIHQSMSNLTKKTAKPTIHMLCPWCDFKDYCDSYQSICKKSKYDFLPLMNYNNTQLIEEWQNVKATKKILELREKELSSIMLEKIKQKHEQVKTDTEEIYIRQNSKKSYDLNTVHEAVPTKDFVDVVTLNKKKVESYMDINPAVKDKIMESVIVNYTRPFLATKKIKKIKKSKPK